MTPNEVWGAGIAAGALIAGGFVIYRNVIVPKQVEASHQAHVFGDTPFPNGNPPADKVVIGPTLWDGDHSVGMPQHPTPHPSGVGWTFRFPRRGAGKVDYVCFPSGSLAGKSKLRIEGELTEVGDAQVMATPQPEDGDNGVYKARMTPFIEEDGDDWSAAGADEPKRQYFDTDPTDLHYLKPGPFVLEASLAGPGWGGTQTSTFENNPAGFHAAVNNAYAVGVVFGGNGIGIGHGADDIGTDPNGYAELWVKSFPIE